MYSFYIVDDSLKHKTCSKQLLRTTNVVSRQACKTTLSIGEVLELQGACYEELQETYNRARQLAQQASNLKLEATVLRELLGVQKRKSHDELAREYS
jgi:hypothetical protein